MRFTYKLEPCDIRSLSLDRRKIHSRSWTTGRYAAFAVGSVVGIKIAGLVTQNYTLLIAFLVGGMAFGVWPFVERGIRAAFFYPALGAQQDIIFEDDLIRYNCEPIGWDDVISVGFSPYGISFFTKSHLHVFIPSRAIDLNSTAVLRALAERKMNSRSFDQRSCDHS